MKTQDARANPLTIRRHLLLEPFLALAAAFVGWNVAEIVLSVGINHLGWFALSCDPPNGGIASCIPLAGPSDAWPLAGSAFALAVWILLRRWRGASE